MKEKSVKNMLKSEKSAAPAKPKKGQKDKKGDGDPLAAPALPKAKAKGHEKKDKKGKGGGKGKSREGRKELPCVYRFTKEGGCLKGKDCQYSHCHKHKASCATKARRKGVACPHLVTISRRRWSMLRMQGREVQLLRLPLQRRALNPGKWKQRLKPAAPWWFNFDLYPHRNARSRYHGLRMQKG